MTRPDSIRAIGLPEHVNSYCEKYGVPRSYADLDRWLSEGDEFGDPVKVEWLRRRFKRKDGRLVNRNTMAKWIAIYKEQHSAVQGR